MSALLTKSNKSRSFFQLSIFISFIFVLFLPNKCVRIKLKYVWADVLKAVRKAAGCGWSEDMISALHQQHSNMSQATSGLMLIVFTLQTCILFWQLRIFKMGQNNPSHSVDVNTLVEECYWHYYSTTVFKVPLVKTKLRWTICTSLYQPQYSVTLHKNKHSTSMHMHTQLHCSVTLVNTRATLTPETRIYNYFPSWHHCTPKQANSVLAFLPFTVRHKRMYGCFFSCTHRQCN